MAHAREQIRDQVVTELTGLASTGSRVYAHRIDPFATLPALNVLTLDEEVRDDLGAMDTTQIRELRLHIQGRAKSADVPDDVLDTIADEVEEAMLNSSNLSGLAWDMSLESSDFSYDRDGSNPVGMVDMVFAVLYQTDGTDPSTIS